MVFCQLRWRFLIYKPNILGTYATIGILMIELTFWGIEDKFLWILKKQKVPT